MAQFEKATVGEKVAGYVEARTKLLVGILVAVIAVLIVYAVSVTVVSKSNAKGLDEIDMISYNLTKDSSELSDEDLNVRRDAGLSSLNKLNAKSGVVGVRANMLSAEIAYSMEKYEDAANFWLNASNKDKKAYTSSLSKFNAATCFENLENLDKAEECYKAVSTDEDFSMSAHAAFSLGRVREAKGDVAGAIDSYKALYGKDPDSSWGKLAKSRLLVIEK